MHGLSKKKSLQKYKMNIKFFLSYPQTEILHSLAKYNQLYTHKRNFKSIINKYKSSSLLQNIIMHIANFFSLSVYDYNTVIRELKSLKQLRRAFT